MANDQIQAITNHSRIPMALRSRERDVNLQCAYIEEIYAHLLFGSLPIKPVYVVNTAGTLDDIAMDNLKQG